jgi:hypothetical protein
MLGKVTGLAVAVVILVGSTGVVTASAKPPSRDRLLTYLWNYRNWLLRPYVSDVTLSGGHVVVVKGRPRLTGATANVHETLRDQPSFTRAAIHICRIASFGVQRLHLGTMSAVHVWSVEGHLVARC